VALVGAVFRDGHPYHGPIGGTAPSLAAIRYADVEAFLRSWYGPTGAVLVLAGDLPDGTREMVERYFGSLPPNPQPALPKVPSDREVVGRKLDFGEPFGKRPAVLLGWPTPEWLAKGAATAEIAAKLIQDARRDSRLVGARLGVRVGATQLSMSGRSMFMLHVIGRREDAPDTLEDAARHRLTRLADGDFTDLELTRARARLRLAWWSSVASLGGKAGALARYAHAAQPIDPSQTLGAYDRVTRAMVQAFAREQLAPERAAMILVSPQVEEARR